MSVARPPTPEALAMLHWLQGEANYGRSFPKTGSDAQRLIWYFIRRRIGWPVEWPLYLLEGRAGGVALAQAVPGVDSIAAQGFAALTGAVILAPGSGIALSEAGQIITITNSQAPGLSSLILFDSTLGADAASIDTGANGIAQTAVTLMIDLLIRTTEVAVFSQVNLRLNGDAGANYDWGFMQVINAALNGGNTLATNQVQVAVYGASASASAAAQIRVLIHGYRQTTFHKTLSVQSGAVDAVAADFYSRQSTGRWRNTAAVNQFSVSASAGNILAGSRMTVYGLL